MKNVILHNSSSKLFYQNDYDEAVMELYKRSIYLAVNNCCKSGHFVVRFVEALKNLLLLMWSPLYNDSVEITEYDVEQIGLCLVGKQNKLSYYGYFKGMINRYLQQKIEKLLYSYDNVTKSKYTELKNVGEENIAVRNEIHLWLCRYMDINALNDEPLTVYVYKNFPLQKGKSFECVWAHVERLDDFSLVDIKLSYCSQNNMYCITEMALNIEIDRKGPLLLNYEDGEDSYCERGRRNGFDNLREESRLKMYGYTVNKRDDIPVEARRKRLVSLIETGIMSQEYIVNHLEWLCKTRPHQLDAQAEWSSDLSFLYNYHQKDERKTNRELRFVSRMRRKMQQL